MPTLPHCSAPYTKYPVWHKNLWYLYRSPLRQNDYPALLDLIRFFAPLAHGWIDRTRIADSYKYRRVCCATFAILNRVADFSLLRPNHPARDIRELYIRLRGLV